MNNFKMKAIMKNGVNRTLVVKKTTNTIKNFAMRFVAILAVVLLAGNAWGTEYELIKELDCATASENGSTLNLSVNSTTAMTAADVKKFIDAAAGSSIVSGDATVSGSVYWTKGQGGDGIPDDVLKVGKASGGGSIGFTISGDDNVDKVVITGYGWKTTSAISVNGSTSQSPTTAASEKDFSFVLSTATKDISISVTTSAVCITSIKLYKEKSGYAVTYNNGGHGTAPTGGTVSSVTLAAITSVTGYTCTGWTANVDVKEGNTTKTAGTDLSNGTTYTILEATQFTAQWRANTYEVAFDANGGSGSTMTNQEFEYDETAKALSTNTYTAPTDQYFYGWHRTKAQADAGNREYADEAEVQNLSSTDGATVTLYAVWKDYTYKNYRTVCNDKYTVTYEATDATDGNVPTDNNEYDKNDEVTVLGNTGNLQKTNYTFAGWTDGENIYQAGDEFTITDFVTLSAVWTCAKAVDVSKASTTANGSFTLDKSGELATCDAAVVVTVTPAPETGYEFSAITQTGLNSGVTINQNAKTVTYAQYANGESEINVTFAAKTIAITWDLNYEGAPSAAVDNYTYNGSSITLPEPEREGYTFTGWWTATTGGTQITEIGTTLKPSSNVTYHAHWTIKNHTIKWSVAGDDSYSTGVTDANNNADHGSTVTAPTAPNASALGEAACADTFKGWSKKYSGSEAQNASYYDDLFTTTSPEITKPTTFYAVFASENETPSTSYASITSGLESGDYVIAYQYNTGDQIVLTNAKDGGTSNTQLEGEKLSLNNSKYVTSDGKYVWTLRAQNDGSYYIYNAAAEKYLNATTSALSMSTTPTKYDISYDSSTSRWIIKLHDNNDYAVHGYVSGTSYDFRVSTSPISSNNPERYKIYLYKNELETTYADYITECAPLTCSAPTVPTSTPTGTGATLGWTAPTTGTAAKYQYAVWADGEDEPTSGYSEVETNSASVSELISNTDYNWKVRAVCTGEDGESEFLKSSFTTGSVNLMFFVPEGASAVAASTSANALPSAGVPAACGDGCWVFAGWSTNANATSVEYNAGSTYKFNGDKTLYAVYGLPSSTYKRIDNAADLTANTNYIITAISSETEYALTSEAHASWEKDAKSLDITAKVEEVSGDYFISNPDANYIWEFTGNASAGKLYNAEAHKYIQLSNYSNSSILDAIGENLVFTSGSDAKWTIKNGTAYLRCYSSGFDASASANVYLYKQQTGTMTTNPDCSAHTVKWYVIDTNTPIQTDNDVTSCDGIASLPNVNVAGVRCKTANTVFRGWSETNVGYEPIDAAPADLFTDAAAAPAITEDKNFYAVFAEATQSGAASKTVKYSVATASTINTTGTAPAGASASYSQTYTNGVGQMTQNNSTTLTLSNWGTTHITKLVLSMRSNSLGGRGSLKYSTDEGSTWSYIVGSASGEQPQFSASDWNSSWSTSYVDVTKNVDISCVDDNDCIIKIEATASSLYCQSYEITYDEPVYSYDDYFTECCPQKAVVLSGVDDEVGKHFEADVEAVCAGETVTLTKTENGYYNFAGFTVTDEEENNVDVTANLVTGKYTFVMPETAVTVTASWTAKNYIATITDPDPAEGSVEVVGGTIVSEQRQVAYGGALTVTAHPKDDDHYFQNWTVSPAITGLNTSNNPMVITMPGNNITVTANFGAVAYPALTLGNGSEDEYETANYKLTATLANGEDIPNMGAVRSGTAIKVTYTLKGQNEFDSWKMNDGAFTTFSTEGNVATFNMPDVALNIDLDVIAYYTLGLSATNGSISVVEINDEEQDEAASYNVHEGDIIEVTAEPDNGYKFKQWNKTGIDDEAFEADGAYALFTVGTANMTLEAEFELKATYDLKLMVCGKVQETLNGEEGTPIYSLISGKTAPALLGYTFMGWSETEDGTVISNNDLKLNNNKEVYAVYRKEAYYEKVTATNGITNGQYLIVYETGEVAFDGGLTSLNDNDNYINVAISNNKIVSNSTTDAASFTINATETTIQSASEYYIGRTSNGNGLDASKTIEYTNNISIEDGNFKVIGSGGAYLRFNSASNQMRFRYFKSDTYSSQKAIQLYKKIVPEENESNPTTVVASGEELVISEASVLNNLTVEAGGKVSGSANLTVNNLTIESEAGKSGQVMNATNVTANAVYMDVTFFKGATALTAETADRWYMISAPFDVNLNGGFFQVDGTPMVFGTDFDLFEYDGNKRATTGTTGWKRAQGKMNAGVACLIGFNENQSTTIRLKAASAVGEPTSIALQAFAGDDDNQNWNGVANPTLHYTDINKDVQTYNNEDGENGRKYIAYTAASTSFVVGTAFFVQETGSIDLSAATHDQFRAPKRAEANERYEACVRLFRQEATEFADQMYVRASESAMSEYEQGHDMITWNDATGKTAMIWAENYGMRLAIEEAPLVNDKASYELGIFAPAEGTYRIEANDSHEDATLYLTYNERAIWNLSMSACEVELTKGLNEGYGLKLVVKAPQTPTGVEDVQMNDVQCTKMIIDEKVFILRGGKMYDVTGKAVR